jgi:hypothetical protein
VPLLPIWQFCVAFRGLREKQMPQIVRTWMHIEVAARQGQLVQMARPVIKETQDRQVCRERLDPRAREARGVNKEKPGRQARQARLVMKERPAQLVRKAKKVSKARPAQQARKAT